MGSNINVSGVGCCLVDRVYNNISFKSDLFLRYLSKERGDGGLTPGHLVFKEEFESFSGTDVEEFVAKLARGKPPDKINIGGPGVVAMIHAAQMASGSNCTFQFYGRGANDNDGRYLLEAMADTPVLTEYYQLSGEVTPSTIVLSDPAYDKGTGERIFINTIGAAWDYTPDSLDHRFFSSDVVVFGGTALVPAIHDHLSALLSKAKSNRCITIVNTVYDFRNEKANPDQKWPLGESDESYAYIDLLIVSFEEALRLSGKSGIKEAMKFFKLNGTGAVIVTNGSQNIHLYAGSKSIFGELPFSVMPVSNSISRELKMPHNGDTTGCGDNFAGGLIYSVASQLERGNLTLDLKEACKWGIVSGGYACFYMGGTYIEDEPGEKLRNITPYYNSYPG
jgi:sugar/nucleoside kinase (ribokinase family)